MSDNNKIRILTEIVYNALRTVLKSENYAIYGVIVGSMSSGKTTLALTLASIFKRMFSDSKCYITQNLDYLTSIDKLDGKYVAIVFDDVSNRIRRFSNELTNIYTVRHKGLDTINKNIFMLFNCHYLRSIAPFIRSAPLRALTSISEAEIKAYTNEYLFTTSVLWDYLYYVNKYPDKFITLISVRGRERIIDVTNVILNECEILE